MNNLFWWKILNVFLWLQYCTYFGLWDAIQTNSLFYIANGRREPIEIWAFLHTNLYNWNMHFKY